MDVLAIVALIALAFAAAAPALYALRGRLAHARELELGRMLAKRGLTVSETACGGRAFAAAFRRCALCTNIEACRQWLAGKSNETPRDFCPNARYLERLERQ